MSEQKANQNSVFNIKRMYLKDLSLELPNAPKCFLETGTPTNELLLDLGVDRLNETFFEVTVMVRVTSKIEDRVLFVIEAKQSGIFEIMNIPDATLGHMLFVTCPAIIYPYLRSNIADVTSRATLLPVHLSEAVNFQQLYEQRQKMQIQEEQNAQPDAEVVVPTYSG